MRAILFRGKSLDGEWLRGWYTKALMGAWPLRNCIVPISDAEAGYRHEEEILGETVSQYTGVDDVNGNPIFEGDIIAAHLDIDHEPDRVTYGFISWNKEHAGWSYNEKLPAGFNGTVPDDMDFEDVTGIEEWTVVGNIWDNPELMKGNENSEHGQV